MFQMPVRQRPDSPRSAAQRWGAGLAAASVLVWSGLAAAAPAPESFSELAKKVSPAVVNIASTQEVEAPRGLPGMPFNFPEGSPFEEFFKRFGRSEEHTSELQSLMRISYAVFCLKKKKNSIKLKIDINQIPNSQCYTTAIKQQETNETYGDR